MKTYYVYIMVLVSFALTACSSPEKSERRGDLAIAIGEYHEAGVRYKQAYQHTPNKDAESRGRRAFKQGEAFRKFGYTARAVSAYRSAIRYGYDGKDSIALRHLGDMLRFQADYKGASNIYSKYLELAPNDTLAQMSLRGAQTAAEIKAKGSPYTVKQSKIFNSNRSDYCPVLMPDGADAIYFTSNRSAAAGDDLSNITGQKLCDIFTSKKDEKGRWKNVEPVEGGLNSALDEATPALSPDGKTMYITYCGEDATYPRMAQIATSTRSDATWSKPEPVKITNDTLSNYAHPAVSPDGRWLYFASDMPGGYGGLDLWRCTISNKSVGIVENLGPDINTKGNEEFPAFRPSGELYFSSDGHGGMGGLDIYRATEDTVSKTWTIAHLPYPMNSQGDDFGITFEGLHNRGFFSSSRSTGGRGWDKIYEFSYPEKLISVKGWVYEQDGYELPDATVYMVGDDGTNVKTGVRADGSFEQPLLPGVNYVFLATCKGYLNVPQELSVEKREEEFHYTLQFPLPSISNPVIVRNVFYEFDSAEITPDSEESLSRLQKMLAENPNVTIELSAHCDYRGDSVYNRRLSQRRAENVMHYLTAHDIDTLRLTAVGYGEDMPKTVNRKLAETHTFLHEGDVLTEDFITAKDSMGNSVFSSEQQEICNALNRRTEFRVLRTTYGLFDSEGRLIPEALMKVSQKKQIPKEGEESLIQDDFDGAILTDEDDVEFDY